MTQLDALVAPLVAHLETLVLASGYVHSVRTRSGLPGATWERSPSEGWLRA